MLLITSNVSHWERSHMQVTNPLMFAYHLNILTSNGKETFVYKCQFINTF